MSEYTTSANLQKRIDPRTLAQLADDATTAIRTAADATTSLALPATAAIITSAITDASAFIDGYLLDHVDLTDATVLATIEYHAATVALYLLYRRRYMDGEQNPMYPAYVQTERWLRGVAKGELHLDNAPLSPSSSVRCSTTGNTRDFDSTTLDCF